MIARCLLLYRKTDMKTGTIILKGVKWFQIDRVQKREVTGQFDELDS